MQLSILCPTSDCALDWRAAYARLSDIFQTAGFQTRALPWTELADSETAAAAACLAWGYHLQPTRWIDLLRSGAAMSLANCVRTLIWNSDKIYLQELAQSVPVVPTDFVATLDDAIASTLRGRFRAETLVAKPRWGAGAHGLTFLRDGESVPPLRDVLVQPMLTSIPVEGEISLIYFDGRFSHAVRKIPAAGDFRVQSEFGGSVEDFPASDALVELGTRAIQAAPDALVYARVDIVKGNDGSWQVIELEAIEPELFLGFAPDAGRALGQAFRRRFFPPE